MTSIVNQHPENRTCATTVQDVPRAVADVAAVLTGLPRGVIDGGEIVLLAIKPSLWRPFFDSASWLVCACLAAGMITTLGRPIPGLSAAASAQLVLILGLARLAWASAQWAPRWHVLTNRRIIDIRGVRTPSIVSLRLVDVRNTYLRRPLPERLTGLGSILFVACDPSTTPGSWRSVREPEAVHAKIRRAIESAIDLQHTVE